MNAIIVIGWKRTSEGHLPESLYVGLSGIEAAEAAEKAAKQGVYYAIKKLVNPQSFIPLPVVAVSTSSPLPIKVEEVEEEAKSEVPVRKGSGRRAVS
jgi:hypothetical protein